MRNYFRLNSVEIWIIYTQYKFGVGIYFLMKLENFVFIGFFGPFYTNLRVKYFILPKKIIFDTLFTLFTLDALIWHRVCYAGTILTSGPILDQGLHSTGKLKVFQRAYSPYKNLLFHSSKKIHRTAPLNSFIFHEKLNFIKSGRELSSYVIEFLTLLILWYLCKKCVLIG